MDLVKQLWRGEVSLVRAYWIFAVLVGVLITFAWSVIETTYVELYQSLGQLPIYVFLALIFIYFPFIYIAIWRSANNYKGSSTWANLAKVAVIFGVFTLISSAVNIYKGFVGPVSDQLQDVVVLLNKSLPIKVDELTWLNSVSAGEKQFTYHYQIVDKNYSVINSEEIYNQMRPRLIKEVCDSENFQGFLREGIAISYSYTGDNDAPITNILISPADCGY